MKYIKKYESFEEFSGKIQKNLNKIDRLNNKKYERVKKLNKLIVKSRRKFMDIFSPIEKDNKYRHNSDIKDISETFQYYVNWGDVNSKDETLKILEQVIDVFKNVSENYNTLDLEVRFYSKFGGFNEDKKMYKKDTESNHPLELLIYLIENDKDKSKSTSKPDEILSLLNTTKSNIKSKEKEKKETNKNIIVNDKSISVDGMKFISVLCSSGALIDDELSFAEDCFSKLLSENPALNNKELLIFLNVESDFSSGGGFYKIYSDGKVSEKDFSIFDDISKAVGLKNKSDLINKTEFYKVYV